MSAVCECGHEESAHDGKYDDCAARCLCDKCPSETRNDCWCAGYKPAGSVAVGVAPTEEK